ncbi:MAG: YgjP-like metallopeptidase domain-containing protein, partial [Planctomycetota bacterium]
MQDLSVSYRRSTRAKRMRITVHPTQEVTVTVPRGFSLKRAEAFVQSKQAWIRKHLIKNQQIEDIREKQPELSPQELERVQNDLFSRLERFSDQYDLPYRRAAFRCQKTN